MSLNPRLLTILTILNLLATSGIGWWVSTQNHEVLELDNLEDALKELAQNKPQFLVKLLNESANHSAKEDEEVIEATIFEKRSEVLKAGISLKNPPGADHKTLVVFADLTNSHSLAYLKNVKEAMASLPCSVRLIPVALFGEKATEQAKLITAAATQSVEKALQLALSYSTVLDADNNMLAEAEKLGLDVKKLSQDSQQKLVNEEITAHAKLCDDLLIFGVPTIVLLTNQDALVLPPAEAKDLPGLIEHPKVKTAG